MKLPTSHDKQKKKRKKIETKTKVPISIEKRVKPLQPSPTVASTAALLLVSTPKAFGSLHFLSLSFPPSTLIWVLSSLATAQQTWLPSRGPRSLSFPLPTLSLFLSHSPLASLYVSSGLIRNGMRAYQTIPPINRSGNRYLHSELAMDSSIYTKPKKDYSR